VYHKKDFSNWIVFEDDDYFVINKPPYISTLADRSGAISVLELAKEHLKDCQVCHRLDKETSGALVIAKKADAYKHANTQFAERTIEKIYHAVADDLHNFKNEEIDLPLHTGSSGMVRVNNKTGKPSITVVSSLKHFKYHTLFECRPVTGRTHQIRVHLAAIGAPLVADIVYGGKDLFLSQIKKKYRPKLEMEERPIMARVALHAYLIKFKDLKGNWHQVACPYPKDFRTVINQLEKNS